jgi:dTDP-4-amino-4,6-dideoxygalactose transaminase
MSVTTTEQLAIHGGVPAAPGLQAPVWPPRSEATAKKLSEVYLSGEWSFNGAQERAFCEEFAAYHGAKYGIFMANGTVTLQCALQALNIGPGDEVIVPAFTWIATASAVLEVGATPVFVDVEESTLCMDPALMEAAVTSRTKAVIPVHLLGSMADLDAILEIAKRHSMRVIEDCAHGHGGKWKGRGLGSWGDIGSFSFQESKTMASGEGGICLTNDEEIYQRLYRLKHIGYGPATAQGGADSSPDAGLLCHNYRGTEFQAVILRDQLTELPQRIETYGANAALLEEKLKDVPGVRVQSRGRRAAAQSYYCWCILLEDELAKVSRSVLQSAFRAEGLNIGGTYGPVYRHLLWNAPSHTYRLPEGGCPVTEVTATQNAWVMLHSWLGANAATIEAIGTAIAKVAWNVDALESDCPDQPNQSTEST